MSGRGLFAGKDLNGVSQLPFLSQIEGRFSLVAFDIRFRSVLKQELQAG